MEIETVLDDIRNEPPWRHTANRESAYYDCNQLDADVIQAMENLGMLPVSRPLIPAAVDVVLGMEARSRRDFLVVADEEQDSDEAKALGVRLHEVERLSKADEAVSDAYAGQIKVGVGWVEVGSNPDPFAYPHRCRSPSRRELWWDWRADQDQAEWRYVVRRKWFDIDRLQQMFPGKRDLLQAASRSFPGWATDRADSIGAVGRDDAEELYRRAGIWDIERSSAFDEQEWRETARDRLCLFEVWYRVWERADLLRVPQADLVLEFDRGNPRHRMLVETGIGELDTAVLSRMRLAYWAGPHKLADIASPYAHGHFPYVPFFGLREDRTGVYYGLIRRMMSTQDAINAGLTKMHHLMTSTMVMGDSDAFEQDLADVAETLGQKNAVIPLNPRRINANQRPDIRTDRELSAQHFGVLQEAQRLLPEMAGIYQALQGKEMPQQSGVAIASLVEQGTTGLAKTNANYTSARKQVGQLLLANEIERLSGREFSVQIEKLRQPTQVWFNRREVTDDGRETLTNDLTRLQTRVELADAPQTATYKQQLMQGLMSLTESMPDSMKAAIIPMVIRGTDYPDREEVASLIEQQLGIGGEQDPAQALNRQREQALAQRQQQLALDAAAAKVEGDKAKTEKVQAEVDRLRIEVQELVQRIQAAEQDRQIQQAMVTGQIPPPAESPGGFA